MPRAAIDRRRPRDPQRLRELIKARDLSLRELGLLCGTNDASIYQVLQGNTTNARVAKRLARTLRRPVGELFAVVGASGEQDDPEQEADPAHEAIGA